MQELAGAKQGMLKAVQQVIALKSGVLQHACSIQRHTIAVAAVRETVLSQTALAISQSTITASKAFAVLRSQANVHTASAVHNAFASVVDNAREEIEANRQATRVANHAVNMHCLHAAVRLSLLKVRERRRIAMRASALGAKAAAVDMHV
jgi:hypothetical protein